MSEERPQYRVLAKSFFAPHMLEPDTVIYFDGAPGINLEPLNDAAKAAQEAHFKKHPELRTASLHPTDDLPNTFSIVTPGAARDEKPVLDAGGGPLLNPGLAEGGTVEPEGTKVVPGPASDPKNADKIDPADKAK